MMSVRTLARGLLLLTGCLTVAAAQTTATPADYFPYRAGVRVRYQTRTTLSPNEVLTWETAFLRSSVSGEAERLVLRSRGQGWQRVNPLEREERYLRERRGLFTPDSANGVELTSYGPLALLPPVMTLERLDEVWRYEGVRTLPFAFHLLGIIRNGDRPVLTSGRYHVLSQGPITTLAGEFEAVQVSGVERVSMLLLAGEPEDILLRVRRYYVRGLGLACEQLQFLDLPRLGVLTTEVVAYDGLAPVPLPAAPKVAARAGDPAEKEE